MPGEPKDGGAGAAPRRLGRYRIVSGMVTIWAREAAASAWPSSPCRS